MTAHTVAVDARRNSWAPELGISRYSRNLIRSVLAARPSDLRVRPVDLTGSPVWTHAEPVRVRAGHGLTRRFLQEQIDLPRAASQFDLLHLCWYEGPLAPRRPVVVAVHDLDTIEHPEHYRLRFKAYYNSLLRRYVRSAARILVPSQATEEALRRRWPGARTAVVPLGVDPVFAVEGPRYVPKTSARQVIAYTGGYNGRKRVDDLLRAFEVVADDRSEVMLLLTGNPPPDVRHALAESPRATRIEITGYLNDEELAAVYRAADLVVYPSTTEGFGFPVVEAFASGTPVIASSTGSLPELVGNAGVLVELGDVTNLVDGINRLLDDEQLAASLRTAGLKRARSYRWETTAKLTMEWWRDAVG